ncbi:peptide deformylase [Rothia sp. ZJ1223]|uniref:peptide deformylase n=1 Tax=Rothia sp. ZJ1223 TaxID=2811098 RepID=UPI00195784F6|nr:peptide deformylase [Rothia sp. ZJ1223]MBM7050681.1 peptide deformylase [Rothia sp. ZJ1223]
MTILTIRTVGDPVLRTECEDITVFDEQLRTLVADMLETMYEVNGVGLAGPQVGISKRIFTYGNIAGCEGHVINPVLTVGEEDQEGGEGCLSVPGLSSETPRKNWAKVIGVDMYNQPVEIEGEGLFARMLQHETDHLYGKMFIDRVVGEDKKRIMRAIRAAQYNDVSAAVIGERAPQVSSSFGAGVTSKPAGSAFGFLGGAK